jgi:NADPH:quinone reductase-like Zn-dependent oxidoreductase
MQLTQHSGRFTTIVPEDPVFTLPSWVRGSMPIVKNLTVNFTFVGSEAFMHSKERWTIYSQQLFQLAQLVDQNHLPPPETTLVGDFCIETVKQAHQLLEEGRVKGKLVMSVP